MCSSSVPGRAETISNLRLPTRYGELAARGISAALILFTVTACNRGEGNGGGGTPSANPNIINGLSVPPDPGQAANGSVAGVDSDANGIRDEIDRFIATRYGANPNQVAAAQIAASTNQAILQTDAANTNAAFSAMTSSADSGICAGLKFEANGVADVEKELDEIFLRSFNTPERIAQKQAVAEQAGQFTRSVSAAVCP